MQVKIEFQEPKFQPKTLSIVFESQEELSLFTTMFQSDCSIPDLLFNNGNLTRQRSLSLGDMMENVHTKLSQL